MEAVWVVDSLCYKFGKRDAGHLFAAEVFSHKYWREGVGEKSLNLLFKNILIRF